MERGCKSGWLLGSLREREESSEEAGDSRLVSKKKKNRLAKLIARREQKRTKLTGFFC